MNQWKVTGRKTGTNKTIKNTINDKNAKKCKKTIQIKN